MFEWDEAKRIANLAKHGVDFWDAIAIFDGFLVEFDDARRDYGERRIGAYGATAEGDVLFVVYTWRRAAGRSARRRIISARRAGRDEGENYRRAQAQAR